MTRFIITASDADLGEIIDLLRQIAGDGIARKYTNEFDTLCDRLMDFPGSEPRSTI